MKQFTMGRTGLALLTTAAVCLSLAAVASAGSSPTLTWSSSSGSFDYGAVDAGQTPSQTFTLTNSGGSATSALKVSLPSSSAYAITSDTCTGTSLGPGKSCTVTVQYTPATGSDSAVLAATSKKASVNATLTGSKAPPPPPPQSQIDCQNFQGLYLVPGGASTFIWRCAGWVSTSSDDWHNKLANFATDCAVEGGVTTVSSGEPAMYPGFTLTDCRPS